MADAEATPASTEQATGNVQPQTHAEGQASSESAATNGTPPKKSIDLFAKGKTQGEKDALRAVLKDLGVSSLDEAKAVLAALREQPSATDDADPPVQATSTGQPDLAAEARRLKKELARRDALSAADKAKLDALTAEKTAREQVFHRRLAHGAIETAAAAADAYDPAIVRQLLQDRVTLDEDGDTVVLDAPGGNPTEMSVSDLMGLARKSHPFLFRASVQSGAGSRAPNGSAGAGGIPKAPTTAAEWEAVLRAAR